MQFLEALWAYIVVSAPYLLLGLTLSGFIKQFIPMELVHKWLGPNNMGSVVKASFVGVPLPLCSCSVIPTAVTLRKSGASKASTSSFLISTPESGVDSIAMTYAMMDIPMTILRPIAAFFSAFFAGALQLFFNKGEEESFEKDEPMSCCSKNKAVPEKLNVGARIKKAFDYGFNDLSDDIAFWLGIGLLLGALIQVIVPENFFMDMGAAQSRMLILLVGIPVYICASATTPIAASLVLKGMSPGSALLLLLVGPATNISNILVLQKYIGKKGVIINVIAVALAALLFSFIADFLYSNYFATSWHISMGHEHDMKPLWQQALGVFLIALIAKGIFKEKIKPMFKKKAQSCH